jgi:hypothetical protein
MMEEAAGKMIGISIFTPVFIGNVRSLFSRLNVKSMFVGLVCNLRGRVGAAPIFDLCYPKVPAILNLSFGDALGGLRRRQFRLNPAESNLLDEKIYV